ncbi:hypothetical protein AVEN_154973-1 [Araneus ventricosus]|uniref:Uncharacterized protein n=1 Tax=Araneus ventricosus TaxID=182803 RepID=A0A4Y2A7A3_ARAVE|nr:hypothetical protein AVEN_154973-1 [Araneus ventricosus]
MLRRGIVKFRASSTTALIAVREVKPFEVGRERAVFSEEDNILSNPVTQIAILVCSRFNDFALQICKLETNLTRQECKLETTYVIVGGFLLHRVICKIGENFSAVLGKYVAYIKKYHNEGATTVVFDGYPEALPEKITKIADDRDVLRGTMHRM